LQFLLKDYTQDELRLIFKNKFTALDLKIEEDALAECVNRCRNSIREANSIAKRLKTLAINADTDIVDKNMALEYFQIAEIDPIGLKAKDLEILNVLLEDNGEAMAGDTIAARVGLDVKKYYSEYEAYLIKIGFINITGRGRCLTKKAVDYLKPGDMAIQNDE
jgi:Holliday junction DNA helicase RuvB